jgi:hypothetical protein
LDITPEFQQFGSQFHQDYDLFVNVKKEEDLIRYGLEQLTDEQKIKLKQFLTELLSSKPSPETLDELWLATGTDIYFSRGLDTFLAMTRDAIPD